MGLCLWPCRAKRRRTGTGILLVKFCDLAVECVFACRASRCISVYFDLDYRSAQWEQVNRNILEFLVSTPL